MFAPQAHAVPKTAARPRGPFPPELYLSAPVITDYIPEEDHSLPGATAQNGFKPERLLRCRICSTDVYESETGAHRCPEEGPDMTTSKMRITDDISLTLNPTKTTTEEKDSDGNEDR